MWRHKIRQWRRPYTSPLSSCLYALLLSSRYPSGDGVRDDDSGGVQTSVQVGRSVCFIAQPLLYWAQLIIKLKKNGKFRILHILYSSLYCGVPACEENHRLPDKDRHIRCAGSGACGNILFVAQLRLVIKRISHQDISVYSVLMTD